MLHVGQHVADGHGVVEGEELGEHEPAGGILVVAGQAADLVGDLGGQGAQDGHGLRVVDGADEVGPVVAGEFLEDVGGLGVVYRAKGLDGLGGLDGGQRLDDLGGRLCGEQREQPGLLVAWQGADGVDRLLGAGGLEPLRADVGVALVDGLVEDGLVWC